MKRKTKNAISDTFYPELTQLESPHCWHLFRGCRQWVENQWNTTFLWHLWQQKSKNSCDACVRVRARGWFYGYFYNSISPFFNLHFSVSFIPTLLRSKKRAVTSHKTTRCFSQNDTLFLPKRHVVSPKTTRCFSQNDPLFLLKRHVVSPKTTRCFS